MGGRIIGIISIKGGVGKTTAVSNLGSVLTRKYNKKVIIVDANFSAPNLALQLGMFDVESGFSDVLNKREKVSRTIYKHKLGFDILPTKLFRDTPDLTYFRQYISSLRSQYDFVILDSSPNLNYEMLAVILASDELYAVTTPDNVTLGLTLHAIKVAQDKGMQIRGIILNKLRNKKYEVGVEEIEKETNIPVLAVIESDEMVDRALSKFLPVSLFSPKSRSAKGYLELASFFAGNSVCSRRRNNKISKDAINRVLLEKVC